MTKVNRKSLLISLILFIAFFVYVNSLHNNFVYDDSYVITKNYGIKSLKNLPKLFQEEYFFISGELTYRPVVTFTYFIDYVIWQLNPLGYHLTNIILHTICVFLFFILARNIFNRFLTAVITTFLFLSHPILSETVNAVCYREDILAALFFLVTFIFFIKIRDHQQRDKPFFSYYLISCFSYCLALFSKEMAITLPIILILYDCLCSEKISPTAKPFKFQPSRIKRWGVFYSGYFSVTAFYLFVRFILFRNTIKTIQIEPSSFTTMTKAVASYLKLLFIPLPLNADYTVPVTGIMHISFILSVFMIFSAIFIIVYFYKRNKLVMFFCLWFFITLLPVYGIIPIGNVMAERYLYIPIMGFCGAIGYIITNYRFQNTSIIVMGVILLGLQLGIINRNSIWRDNSSLWLHTYKREPDSARALCNLGNVYFHHKRYDDAIGMYKKALTFEKSYPFIRYNLAVAYEETGKINLAIKEYQASISPLHDNTHAFQNLGNIYQNQGDHQQAIKMYKKAIASSPYVPEIHNNLGISYESTGDSEKAMSEYLKILKIDDNFADAHNNLGALYLKNGNMNRAIDELKKASQLKPNHLDAHFNLGVAYGMNNSYEEAVKEFVLAIKVNPDDYFAYKNLGILTFKYKQNKKLALRYLQEAKRLSPNPDETKQLQTFIQAIKTGKYFQDMAK